MSPAKKFAGCVFAGAAASIPMIAAAQTSPTLMVNDEAPLAVSTFSYAATDSNVSDLRVTSDGFLLCANVGPAIPTSSKKLTPSRPRWTLPSVVDVQSMGYSGGMLRVNKPVDTLSVESTLACTVRTSEGTANPNGPYGDVIFQDAFVPTRDRLYAGMVNWRPDVAFNGWSPNGDSVLPGVPTDPCTLDLNVDTPLVSEASVCAAATGVRPATGETWGQRAATMWTAMAGGKFVYLARIDARIGPQSGPPNGNFPQAPTGFSAPTAGSVDIAIRDAFDSNYLGATASYCFLRALPASGSLTANVCSDAAVIFTSNANGTIQERIGLDAAQFKATSRYIAVVRDVITGSPPSVNAPVAAVAVFASPDVVRHETGNAFTGDDVVFGFPSNIVFDWMH
ncbi:MAG: hypothetical protein RL684_254 [Pseudomonadota bacterium]